MVIKKTICPKCGYNNIGEDNYCQECFANLVVLVPNGYYERWIREMKE